MTWRERITESIRFWERRRIVYNVTLAGLTIYYALPGFLKQRDAKWGFIALYVFMLAVLANILFCAAYVVDLFVQLSDFREAWLRWRDALFAIGVVLACALTWLVCTAIFTPIATW